MTSPMDPGDPDVRPPFWRHPILLPGAEDRVSVWCAVYFAARLLAM
jgi:hypothetical protein